MKRFAVILVALAFAGGVGARVIDDPALGPGAGSLYVPNAVTVCPLGGVSC